MFKYMPTNASYLMEAKGSPLIFTHKFQRSINFSLLVRSDFDPMVTPLVSKVGRPRPYTITETYSQAKFM